MSAAGWLPYILWLIAGEELQVSEWEEHGKMRRLRKNMTGQEKNRGREETKDRTLTEKSAQKTYQTLPYAVKSD